VPRREQYPNATALDPVWRHAPQRSSIRSGSQPWLWAVLQGRSHCPSGGPQAEPPGSNSSLLSFKPVVGPIWQKSAFLPEHPDNRRISAHIGLPWRRIASGAKPIVMRNRGGWRVTRSLIAPRRSAVRTPTRSPRPPTGSFQHLRAAPNPTPSLAHASPSAPARADARWSPPAAPGRPGRWGPADAGGRRFGLGGRRR
jgi:hypothetical protein